MPKRRRGEGWGENIMDMMGSWFLGVVDLDVLHEGDHFLLLSEQLLEVQVLFDEGELLEELFDHLVLVEERTDNSEVELLDPLFSLLPAFLLFLLLSHLFFLYLLQLLVVLRFSRC